MRSDLAHARSLKWRESLTLVRYKITPTLVKNQAYEDGSVIEFKISQVANTFKRGNIGNSFFEL